MQTLKELFFTQTPIDDRLWENFEKEITIIQYKKGDQIVVDNNIWEKYMYLHSGSIRSYIITDTGKEFTRQFYFNTDESSIGNILVTDFRSLLTMEPSTRGFEVLEDCELHVFQHSLVISLCEKHHVWEKVARILAQMAYVQMDEYYCRLLTHTPKEHYLKLKNKMPKLCEEVSQYHLASFLGITPVTLSRIKQSCD